MEGRTITLSVRWAEGSRSGFPPSPPSWSGSPVDVMVAAAGQRPRRRTDTTRTIPVRHGGRAPTRWSGIVASLARPGGNLTGLTVRVAELAGKRLELLKEVCPRSSRGGPLEFPPIQPRRTCYARDAGRGPGVGRDACNSLRCGKPPDVDAPSPRYRGRPDAL